MRSFPSPNNPRVSLGSVAVQLSLRGMGLGAEDGKSLVCDPLSASSLAVCSSSCIPDLKAEPESLRGMLPAWRGVCGTAAWIPRSLPIPSPLTASTRSTVRLLLPCLQRVFCGCPAARAGVCCLFFLFPREFESPRSPVFGCALFEQGEFPRCWQMFYFIAVLPCLAPHPVMGTFVDQRCLLLSEWFPFPAVHSQYIGNLLSHLAVLLSPQPVLAAGCLRDIPLLKHHLRFSLAEIMWGSCRSFPLSVPHVYQLDIHLLQLLHHSCINEVVF